MQDVIYLLNALFRRRFSVGMCIVGMLLASGVGYKLGERALASNGMSKESFVQLKRAYNIEVEARKNLAQHLKTLQQQNAELMHRVALFQDVTGTKFNQQAIKIKAFQTFQTQTPNLYRYLVVLTKGGMGQDRSAGSVAMTIQGKIGDQSILLPVKYVNSERKDGLGFGFRHFQELNGELAFPENFVPEEVHFKIMLDNNALPIEQSMAWKVV